MAAGDLSYTSAFSAIETAPRLTSVADINAEAVSKAIESTRASLRSAKSFLSSVSSEDVLSLLCLSLTPRQKDFTETLKKAVDRSVSTGHQDRKDVALVLDVKEGERFLSARLAKSSAAVIL